MLTAGDLRTVLIPTPVKTAAYTAHHGDFVLVDTTSASVTVTLPLNPPQNSAVGLKQVATASGHTVTVAAPGASSFNLQGGSTTLTLTLLSQGILLQYSSGVWVVQSDDLPLAQLDTRYAAIASLQDPLGLGFASNFLPAGIGTEITLAYEAWYYRLLAGGYAISSIGLHVVASSGNICVAAYARSGSGSSAAPGGGQMATSGAVACPAIGDATVSLGATVSPKITDWVAVVADNGTASFDGTTGQASTLVAGLAGFQAPRTDTGLGGTNSGTPNTVTDTAAVSGDLGKGISGGSIPANTTITAVSAGTGYTISGTGATATATGLTFIIGPHPLPATPSVTTGNARYVYMKGL